MATITKARVLPFAIGNLSRRTGVKIETVRYYERIGIISHPPRTGGGRRVYGPEHVRQLNFIRRSRELGFSINDIRALLALAVPENVSCADVKRIAEVHLAAVRAKLIDLTRLEQILSETVARCSGESAPACPVLDVLSEAG